jgi:L-fucose isomerase-like protein
MNPSQLSIGVIIGNRDFFPDHLVGEVRAEIGRFASRAGFIPVMLSPEETKLGGVETHADARKCAELFRRRRDDIAGVLVVLPNFGTERGVADALKMAALNVPVLVQACPDAPGKLDVSNRRDAWCGKISVCNNLRQAGIPYSLTTRHVTRPGDPSFAADFARFLGVCRVVRGVRKARIGAVGARPGAFNTVRYSEKILERNGISIITIDLSEILGAAAKLDASHVRIKNKLDEIKAYADATAVPPARLLQMARLGVVMDDFIAENRLDATAIQCWNSLQQNHGCNVCTSMSMMSEKLIPSACEVDVTGALTMHAMQLASGTPSALADWNNNYADDPDKCVLFHCGNWAKSFTPGVRVSNAPILGSALGLENTWGALDGRAPAGPLTFARITTDDTRGLMRAYVGEGELTNDELPTFGNRAVARVPRLQQLMRHVCREGFEHHVAINASHTAAILEEAFSLYLGWNVYHHENPAA